MILIITDPVVLYTVHWCMIFTGWSKFCLTHSQLWNLIIDTIYTAEEDFLQRGSHEPLCLPPSTTSISEFSTQNTSPSIQPLISRFRSFGTTIFTTTPPVDISSDPLVSTLLEHFSSFKSIIQSTTNSRHPPPLPL